MKALLLLSFLVPVLASAQQKTVVTGKIKGLKDSSFVILTDVNRATDTLARAYSRKGSFVLRATLKEPTLVNLHINDKTVMTFLKAGNTKFTGNTDQLDKLKITGSSTPREFKTFQQKFDPLFSRLRNLNQQFQYGNRSDSMTAAVDKMRDSLQEAIDVFVSRYRSSPVSAFVIAATMQLSEDILLTESRFNLLKPAATENMYGNFLRETIKEHKITAIGSVAQDFTQADTSGAPISLSSFRGKYVLLDFWASWCGPCRQENPNVVANYQKFNNKNFTVLGISLDRPGQKDRWLQAIHADNLTWTHVSDLQFWSNAVALQYRVQSIPQNFLIDPDGKIVAKNLRGPDLEAKLCEVLGCN